MKPVIQTITSGPLSNCLQAAIASILEVNIEEVPNFNEVREGDWYWEFVKWMENQGYAVIFCYAKGFSRARSNGYGYHLMTVDSPRGDFHHALVGFNGEPVHDPYPGGNCEHRGVYSYEFIVPYADLHQVQEKLERLQNENERLGRKLKELHAASIAFGSYAKAARQDNTQEYMQGYWERFSTFEQVVDGITADSDIGPDSDVIRFNPYVLEED